MSIFAMAWAWKQNVSATECLVLLALADHANDEGDCWPGQKGLGAKCKMARETVNRIINRLEVLRLVTGTIRRDAAGRITGKDYRLNMQGPVTQDHIPPVTDDQGPVTQDHNSYSESSEDKPSKKEPSVRAWPPTLALTDSMREYARTRGVEAQAEFDAWRDDCLAHNRKYADWESAWRGRVRNVPRFSPPAVKLVAPANDKPYFGSSGMANLAKHLGRMADDLRRDDTTPDAGKRELVQTTNGRPNYSHVAGNSWDGK